MPEEQPPCEHCQGTTFKTRTYLRVGNPRTRLPNNEPRVSERMVCCDCGHECDEPPAEPA